MKQEISRSAAVNAENAAATACQQSGKQFFESLLAVQIIAYERTYKTYAQQDKGALKAKLKTAVLFYISADIARYHTSAAKREQRQVVSRA